MLFISIQLVAQPDTIVISAEDSLRHARTWTRQISIMAGPVLSNRQVQFSDIDLDGPYDIYGEVEMMHDAYFIDADYAWRIRDKHAVYGRYSFARLNMSKQARINGVLSVDDLYPLFRNQLYVRGCLSLGKGFSLIPSAHLIMSRSESVMPAPGTDSSWIFPLKVNKEQDFIGYLSAEWDSPYLRTAIFTAYSSIHNTRQWQCGFQIIIYPFGNENLMISSKVLNHNDQANNNLVVEEKVGLAISKSFIAEVEGSFGSMSHYYDDHAAAVYDIFGRLSFKGSGRLAYSPGARIQILFEYQYLYGDGKYEYAVPPLGPSDSGLTKASAYDAFLSQVYMGGVKWSF
jgi:hypothetical protein